MTNASTRPGSKVYHYIEDLQGNRPWGSVLDAGTGANSIQWLSQLKTDCWTAVAGSLDLVQIATKAAGERKRPEDRILAGNWANPDFLEGECFDTVVADYLLGAIEGHAPYFQTYLFRRLRAMTRANLYVTGLEPYVPTQRPPDPSAQLIWQIGRFRDACVLLGGGVPYREYPAQWVVDQITAAGFKVDHLKHYKVTYKAQFVEAQIEIGLRALHQQSSTTGVQALAGHAEVLRSAALKMIKEEGGLRGCRNYVIGATPA